MPAGDQSRYFEYFQNPHINKSIEEIYQDMDAFTGEIVPQDGVFHLEDSYAFSLNLLPPIQFEDTFVKGILFSNAVDYLNSLFPDLSEYYFTVSHTLQPSFSWSVHTDAATILYTNPHREAWFRKTYPHRKECRLVPITLSDMTNEHFFCPQENLERAPEKDIDVLCVSRVDVQKNIHMLIQAAKVFEEKYNRSLKITLITGHEIPENPDAQPAYIRQAYEQCVPFLAQLKHPIEIVTKSLDRESIRQYYRRAKTTVLCSLWEGKCRAIHEAAACDSAIVCFREFNQYLRGENPHAFPPGAGLYAPDFDAESLADTLHQALNNLGEFHPRQQFLNNGYGIKNTFNTLIEQFPYYQEHLPCYEPGTHYDNPWLYRAFWDNYQVYFEDYHSKPVMMSRGIDRMERFKDFYQSHLNLFKPVSLAL